MCGDTCRDRLPRKTPRKQTTPGNPMADKTPEVLPYAYAQALVAIAQGESESVDPSVIAYLEQYDYIKKAGDVCKPAFLVMLQSKQKPMPPQALAELEAPRGEAVATVKRHYWFCRKQILQEIPDFLKN